MSRRSGFAHANVSHPPHNKALRRSVFHKLLVRGRINSRLAGVARPRAAWGRARPLNAASCRMSCKSNSASESESSSHWAASIRGARALQRAHVDAPSPKQLALVRSAATPPWADRRSFGAPPLPSAEMEPTLSGKETKVLRGECSEHAA